MWRRGAPPRRQRGKKACSVTNLSRREVGSNSATCADFSSARRANRCAGDASVTFAKYWRERLAELRAEVSTKASRGAERVFNALVQHAKTPDLYAWPSIKTLCEITGLDRSTVFRKLSELGELGVVFRRRMVDRECGRKIPSKYRLGRKVEEIPERCWRTAVLAVEKPATEPRNRCSPSKSQVSSLENGARSQTCDVGKVANPRRGKVAILPPLEVKRNKEGRRVGFGQSVKSVSPKKSRKALRRTAKRKPQRNLSLFFRNVTD